MANQSHILSQACHHLTLRPESLYALSFVISIISWGLQPHLLLHTMILEFLQGPVEPHFLRSSIYLICDFSPFWIIVNFLWNLQSCICVLICAISWHLDGKLEQGLGSALCILLYYRYTVGIYAAVRCLIY